jgi:ABC-type amino acid transport substrate-binding protein
MNTNLKKNIPLLFYAIVIAFSITGCSTEKKAVSLETIKTYRDIPGITFEEIAAIEAITAKWSHFVHATLESSEAFHAPDGTDAGFAALSCELLSNLFGIPFVQEYRTWEDLKNQFDSHNVDFTIRMTLTPERMKDYYATVPIAHRVLGVYFNKNSSLNIRTERDLNGLRIGFFKDAASKQLVENAYPLLEYEAVEITSFEEAAAKLQSGEVDACILNSADAIAFAGYDFIGYANALPFIYRSVSLTTANAELEVFCFRLRQCIYQRQK